MGSFDVKGCDFSATVICADSCDECVWKVCVIGPDGTKSFVDEIRFLNFERRCVEQAVDERSHIGTLQLICTSEDPPHFDECDM